MPFFSVIIPLYNKERFIEATLKTVLNQKFNDFEIIIINDGSTDKSLQLVELINDNRIKIITTPNAGLSEARNTGIKNANADYIAFIDADDLWLPDYLACITYLIKKHPSESVFATNNYIWHSKKMPKLKLTPTNVCEVELIENYFSLGKNIFSYSSVVFHKIVFERMGFFNNTVNHGEEEEFTIKCLLHYNLVYCKQPKVFYLKNVKDQLTKPNKNKKRDLPDYDAFLINNKNKSLKNYIDFVHFKLVVLFKMEKNLKLVKFYKNKINTSNLSLVQKIKYHLPTPIFYILKSIYVWFSKIFTHS